MSSNDTYIQTPSPPAPALEKRVGFGIAMLGHGIGSINTDAGWGRGWKHSRSETTNKEEEADTSCAPHGNHRAVGEVVPQLSAPSSTSDFSVFTSFFFCFLIATRVRFSTIQVESSTSLLPPACHRPHITWCDVAVDMRYSNAPTRPCGNRPCLKL